MSNLTQISLDFGPEHQALPSPPTGAFAAGGDGADGYMAAEGVGVRLKSYKRPSVSQLSETPEPVNGNLFGKVEETVAVLVPTHGGGTEPDLLMEPGTETGPEMMTKPEVLVGPKVAPEPKRIVKGARKPLPKTGKRGRKSLKQVAAEADLIEIPEDEVLFSKQYYTMGEVAEMFRVNQSLLRFWETEFDILQPRKNKKGDRYFRPIDIKNLHLIYHLLRQRKYTIEGAKDFLKKNKKAEERFEVIRRLQEIKAFLLEWKAQL